MPYYTAVLARSGDGWTLRPSDLEGVADLEDVAEAVRDATRGRGGLAVIEREDEWFALVRVDGDEDPRVMVSDLPAARRGTYGGLFEDLEGTEGLADGDGPLGAGDEGSGRSAAGRLAAPADEGDAGLGGDGPLGGGPAPGGGAGLEDVGDDHDEDDEGFDEELDAEDVADDVVDDLADDVIDDVRDDLGDDEDPAPRVAGSRVAPPSPGGTGAGPAAGLGVLGGGPLDDDGAALPEAPVWAGDLALLEDAGLDSGELREVLRAQGSDSAAALAAIGRAAGFDDVLDDWR